LLQDRLSPMPLLSPVVRPLPRTCLFLTNFFSLKGLIPRLGEPMKCSPRNGALHIAYRLVSPFDPLLWSLFLFCRAIYPFRPCRKVVRGLHSIATLSEVSGHHMPLSLPLKRGHDRPIVYDGSCFRWPLFTPSLDKLLLPVFLFNATDLNFKESG